MSDSFATPWTGACQALLSMGYFQARILQWVAISSSRGSSETQGWNPRLLHWQADSLLLTHQGSSILQLKKKEKADYSGLQCKCTHKYKHQTQVSRNNMIPPTGNIVYAFKIKQLLRLNKLMSGLRSPPSTPTLAPKLGKLPSLPWEPWRDAGVCALGGRRWQGTEAGCSGALLPSAHGSLDPEGAGSCGRDLCFRRTPPGMEWHRPLWKATEQPCMLRAFQCKLSLPGLWMACVFYQESSLFPVP